MAISFILYTLLDLNGYIFVLYTSIVDNIKHIFFGIQFQVCEAVINYKTIPILRVLV